MATEETVVTAMAVVAAAPVPMVTAVEVAAVVACSNPNFL